MRWPYRGAAVLICLCLIVCCLSSRAAAATAATLTESRAVELFRESSPRARAAFLRAEAESAALLEGTALPNPVISWSVEDAGETRDEFLLFEQELPVTGRRGLLEAAAEQGATAARSEARRDVASGVAQVRRAFYDLLFRQENLSALARAEGRIEELARILRLREESGEGSEWDVLRVEHELAAVEVDVALESRALADARGALTSLLPALAAEGEVAATGGFDSGAVPPPLEEAIRRALESREDLRAMRERALEQERREAAAKRLRVPAPVLGAGIKSVESPAEDDSGYVLSISVPIPLGDRGQLEAASARAGREASRAEEESMRRVVEEEVRSAHGAAAITRELLRNHTARSAGRRESIERIARVTMEEGEWGILEILDANRVLLEMDGAELRIRHEAKLAEIELERAMGIEVKP